MTINWICEICWNRRFILIIEFIENSDKFLIFASRFIYYYIPQISIGYNLGSSLNILFYAAVILRNGYHSCVYFYGSYESAWKYHLSLPKLILPRNQCYFFLSFFFNEKNNFCYFVSAINSIIILKLYFWIRSKVCSKRKKQWIIQIFWVKNQKYFIIWSHKPDCQFRNPTLDG